MSKKKVVANGPKKKGRFGGGRVTLFSDPLQAFRAYGAKIYRYNEYNFGTTESWVVTCPFHDDHYEAAVLALLPGMIWQYTCRAFDCGNRPGENKLEMLSRTLSLAVFNFTPESNLDIVCEEALMMRRHDSR